MFRAREMPSPSAIFSTYASITTTMMLARSMANELIPHPIRGYLFSAVHYLFKPRSTYFTLVVEESTGISRNQLYEAAEAYLCTKVSPDTARLKISKTPKEKTLRIMLEKGEKIVDFFEGIELRWRFVSTEGDSENVQYPSRGRSNGVTSWTQKRQQFELSFHKKHKDVVLGSYVPYVLEKAKEINDDQRVLKMHTLGSAHCYGGSISWDSVNLEHPSTFDTLAMEPELKLAVMEDLNKFVKRKEFYKKVGRAWKRGYLLYGPPGTGKSSLVAAMANYLKFDVYDLQLGNIVRDSDLRRVLLGTGNRSILVIEDIDCSVDIPDRRRPDHDDRDQKDHIELTLSGLLNFIDGLWSSCGDERIIVFTTNHKDRLDPALLRPGRMDMHIHMSYCTFRGFETLASNYLGIGGYHRLYPEIEALIDASQVTPAQVAEELLKSEVSDKALEGVVKLLKRKKLEIEEEGPDNVKKKRLQAQPKGTRKNVRNIGKKRVVRKRYL